MFLPLKENSQILQGLLLFLSSLSHHTRCRWCGALPACLRISLAFLVLSCWRGPSPTFVGATSLKLLQWEVKLVHKSAEFQLHTCTSLGGNVWEDATRNVGGLSTHRWPARHVSEPSKKVTAQVFGLGWTMLDGRGWSWGGFSKESYKKKSKRVLWLQTSVANQDRCPTFTPRPNARLFLFVIIYLFVILYTLHKHCSSTQRLIKSPVLLAQQLLPAASPVRHLLQAHRRASPRRHNGARCGFGHLLMPSEPLSKPNVFSPRLRGRYSFDYVKMPMLGMHSAQAKQLFSVDERWFSFFFFF